MSHFRVGLTGGVATGKSTVTQLFRQLNITVIDADELARPLLNINSPIYNQLLSRTGEAYLLPNGEFDRKALRELIFTDSESKLFLEQLMHPVIRQLLLEAAEEAESNYCILSVPLLIESKMQDLVDRIAVIDISPSLQLARLMARDHISENLALDMISQQATREARLRYADDIIDNSQSEQYLLAQVNALHTHYSQLAQA
jgi:dephospho-CoA kinase